jgi:hypothetical protein
MVRGAVRERESARKRRGKAAGDVERLKETDLPPACVRGDSARALARAVTIKYATCALHAIGPSHTRATDTEGVVRVVMQWPRAYCVSLRDGHPAVPHVGATCPLQL